METQIEFPASDYFNSLIQRGIALAISSREFRARLKFACHKSWRAVPAYVPDALHLVRPALATSTGRPSPAGRSQDP